MSDRAWHWTEAGTKRGPGTTADLTAAAADGRVTADDRVWHDGLATWTAVRDVPEVARLLPTGAASPPVIGSPGVTPPGQLGYYSNVGSLPPRAAATLLGHGRPSGDVGDWPLDDRRLDQLAAAAKARKRIVDAAGLFRALFALSLILAAIVLIGGLFALAGRPSARPPAVALGVVIAVVGGLAVLYYFAARATLRSQRWAPVTMLVVFGVGVVLNLVGVGTAAAAGGRNGGGGAVAINLVSLLLSAAFAYTAGRAVAAIPEYLRQPAWCQEVIARVEKRA